MSTGDDAIASVNRLGSEVDRVAKKYGPQWTVSAPLSTGIQGALPFGWMNHFWSADTVDQGFNRGMQRLARVTGYYWNGPTYLAWPPTHQMLVAADRCKALGVTMLALFTQQPGAGGTAKPGTAPWPIWLQWVKDGTTQLKARGIKYYEILNEPHWGTGPQFTPQEYGQAFVETVDAIKSIQPDAVCMGPSLTASYNDTAWIKSMFQVPGVIARMDMFSMHAYYLTTPEASFMQDSLAIQKLVDGICGRKMRYAITEGGYTDGTGIPTGTNEAVMFDTIAVNTDKYSRWPFLHRGSNHELVSYYKLRRDSTDTVHGENNYGVLDYNWADRGSLTAVLREVFGHVHACDWAANYQRGAWFTRLTYGTTQRLALWSPTPSNEKVWVVADAMGTLTAKVMGGASTSIPLTQGSQQITVAASPRASVLSANVGLRFPEFS